MIAEEIQTHFESLCDAMVAADTEALDALLSDDYTLQHISGGHQTKQEWLADVASGWMNYHNIDIVELTVSEAEQPVLTARTRTDATIWGTHAVWNLQLRMTYTQDANGAWLATEAIATTW